jgi:hypothetical protein
MFDLQVQATGPVFNGQARRAVDDFLTEAEEHVAQEGVNVVRNELGRVLRNPTGFYESQITSDRQRDDMAVTDSKVVYGPWLAGVSSRNQTSRFKGYAHWRRATDRLQDNAAALAEQVLPKFLRRMNG